MADRSSIQWTDATWNPTTGCTKVSPGCAHCYIERTPPLRIAGRKFVDGHIPLQLHADRIEKPLQWKEPRRIFVNSESDLFHPDVPDQFIVDVFGIMALAHWHTFQVLTKRAERMLAFLTAGDHGIVRQFMLLQQNGGTSTRRVFRALGVKRRDNVEWRWPLPNVWLGVSVENQHFAGERIPLLLQTPAAVRFISAEPLLGPVNLNAVFVREGVTGWGPRRRYVDALTGWQDDYAPAAETPRESMATARRLDWVIVGGESGPGARPLWVPWVRSIAQQCRAAGVACFVKQLGADVRDRNDAGFTGDFDGSGTCWPEQHEIDDRIEHDLDGTRDGYQGAPVRIHLRSRKGGDPDEWPIDLRVRAYPEASTT